jgi:hypothetical protein
MRDPRDNLRSILDRLELPGHKKCLREGDTTDIDPVWQLVLDGEWMGLGGEQYIDRLAARWARAAQIYLEYEEEFCLVRYEDFLEDKVGEIVGLTERLGLEQKHDIRDKVDVQYQPRGNRSVDWNTFFGEANLLRIEKRCGPFMKELGYPPRLLEDV